MFWIPLCAKSAATAPVLLVDAVELVAVALENVTCVVAVVEEEDEGEALVCVVADGAEDNLRMSIVKSPVKTSVLLMSCSFHERVKVLSVTKVFNWEA